MDVITGSISPRGVKVSGLISQAVLRGYSAYQIALQNGFEGSMEQWLQSLRGESIEFKSEGLKIYYKYESDTDWNLLVEIDQLLADYSVLDNKPSINNVELNGNKTLDDLGIQAKGNYVEERSGYDLISENEIERLSHVDNYDDTAIQQAIAAIVAAAVTGVKGSAEAQYRIGNVNITPANLGLGNVDNTRDSAKNVHSAVQDSDGNIIYQTYFSGISEVSGEVFLVRPDGTTQKLMNSVHNHDASEITSGTIDIARLPAGALERMIDVADRQARYALTTAQVQNGDTVRQLDTGVMYRVVDDTKLNRSDGYKEYTAGRASAVPWSGIEDKPQTFTPSAHTHEISQITDIANASVAQALKLKNPRSISISGGATATGVQFDGTGNVILQVSALNAGYLSGTADIDILGNAGTATKLAAQRTISISGKATADAKVFDGRYNITLEVTDLDAADKVHTHTMSQITDLNVQSDRISDFSTTNVDYWLDVWFSDQLVAGKPVHNSGIQYNPSRNILKAGTFQGSLTGTASSASALTTDAGSATHPVYFANGVPVVTTYELNATVPADAVFTDTNTHYASEIVIAGNFNSKVDTQTALSNGNVFINHIENNQVTSSHKITGSGTTTVTADEFGNIIVNATGNDYTQGSGISISNYVISNTGVRAVTESTENGNITVNTNGTTSNVPVHGLGTAAFTNASAYATSNHSHAFSSITSKPTTLSGYGITDAASSTHGHDASDITSGTIDIARLPAGAIERLVTVANQAARYALTKSQVQNGDTVQQEDTGVMYRVVDDDNLDKASGYKEYVAGTASAVPWTGITGKPESFTPSTHSHTISDISDIASAVVAEAGVLSTARTISLTGAVTGSVSFDGSENVTLNTSVNHTHQYAGSQTIGGAANEAVKLTTSAGSASYPVYFYEGKPVALSHQLNADVPADAVFTDTHYTSTTVVNSAEDSTTNSSRSITNGNVFLNHVENGTVRSSHRIIGTGVVTVTYNSEGDIVINGIGIDPEYMPTLYALSINGYTYDGSQAIDVGIIDVAHGGTGSSTVDSAPTNESTRMVTSGGVYTALQGKSDTNHTHSYAGSSSAGGSATTAEKLNPLTDAGSGTQPVYFSGGKPYATTYALNATVPADAVFTDTHYASKTVVAGTDTATSDTSSTLTNTNVLINHVENGSVVSSHRISGTGSATVTTDASGNIVINAEDTKYTALPNPYSLSINGQSYNGSEAVTVGVLGVQYGGTGNSSVDTAPTEDSTKMVTSGGVYSALQGKANSSHTHQYAGSSTAGGSATSAVKLDSDAGSATQPIYFSGGKPTACTYVLNKTVPADAVFTDTHYESKNVVANGNNVTTDTSSALTNTHVFLNHVENGTVTSSHRITGTGATVVETDSSGNIKITSTDTKYTELPNPYALTIQGGGTTVGTYDGSEAKTINLTYSNIGAAAASHGHAWSDISSTPTTLAGYGITDQIAAKTHIHDASEIQSGVFDIARIPVAALERLIVVADQTAMYALTTNDVQLGDTVQLEDTGIMYRVVDTTNLDNSAGYKEYTAGVAASVPWSGITNKPTEFTPASHTHMYAASSSVGGPATSANALTSNGGSATQPIYFSSGKPTACTYELNATVPADAVFTDTHHQASLITTNSASSTTQTGNLQNQSVYLNLVENGEVRSSHRILGGSDVRVTTDNSGNITITSNDTKPSEGTGISVSGSYVISNTGVLSIATGSTNGTISVNTGGTSAEVSVYGLGSAAYTASTDYATSGHTHGLSITKTPTATSAVVLDASEVYTLTAGGNTFVFTTTPDTKYTEGTGISISGTTISNSGVRAVSQGSTNGTISVNTGGTSAEVAVHGLGSAAYTASTDYATAGHTHNYAGASTPGGAANSASKLTTAIEIKVDLESVYNSSSNHPTFDGSTAFTAPITGTLAVGNGGTGVTSFTANGILYGNGSGAIAVTGAGAAGNVLTGSGASAPTWTAQSALKVGEAGKFTTARSVVVGLANVYDSSNNITELDGSKNLDGSDASHPTVPITGTLGVAHGGTGATTLSANGVLYGNGTNAVASTGYGTSGFVLKANGQNSAPSWESQSNLVAGSADKLSASRTITLAIASGANGGVTGSATTNFNGDVTIDTTLASHTHAASDINDGILAIARGGTGYGSIDSTPTSGHNMVVTSDGVHKRIAYKKVALAPSGWVQVLRQTTVNGQTAYVADGYSQSIATGNDITANTEIVNVKLVGSMIDDQTILSYTETFTGDNSTTEFTLEHTPTQVTQVTNGGVATESYTVSGNKITMGFTPNTGINIVVNYNVIYDNDIQFSKISQAETAASVLKFKAYSAPLASLTLVVGYVSETLDTLSTQASGS